MKVLVIGATGLVGNALLRQWSQRVEFEMAGTYVQQAAPGLVHLDIRDRGNVHRLIGEVGPDVVALSASNPFVDYCELHSEETRAVNVRGSRNVVESCKREGVKLVFFSSDYVFDGEGEPYSEEAPPRPMNEYGRQKVEIEFAIQESLDDFLIVRLSGVFGWEARMKNFVCQLIRTLESGGPMRLAEDQVYNPTYAINMADVLGDLLLKGERGIFHLVGLDRTTRFEFGLAVAETFGLDTSLLVPARLSELGSQTPRPLRTGLLTEKARQRSHCSLWSIRESLDHMRHTRSPVARTLIGRRNTSG